MTRSCNAHRPRLTSAGTDRGADIPCEATMDLKWTLPTTGFPRRADGRPQIEERQCVQLCFQARNAAVRDALKRALPSRFGMNGQAPVAAEHPDDVRVNHTRGAVEDHDLDSRGNIVPDSWEPFEQGNTSVCRGR